MFFYLVFKFDKSKSVFFCNKGVNYMCQIPNTLHITK